MHNKRLPSIRLVLGLLAAVTTVAACTRPTGPPFSPAAEPPEHRARVYVYRADPRHSLATVGVKIDGREIGRFRDGEYETLELAAGRHHLEASMRGLAMVNLGWNEHRFQTRPGETVYLEITVRLSAHSTPENRSLEIAGRDSGAVSDNVFLLERGRKEALDALSVSTRLVRSRPR